MERHITITNEALALFVRFWLTTTASLPDTAHATAQTKGKERYEGYIDALVRRLANGRTLPKEISDDIDRRATNQRASATAAACDKRPFPRV
jgi:hypothetical protein